ncbi:hypothetical protein [Bombilactobacillus bombi]|uniref:hypothetical protein n=1 Tax=Bombilactobacillus bombi TaxID=1303590 RepID=UPI0035EE02A6
MTYYFNYKNNKTEYVDPDSSVSSLMRAGVDSDLAKKIEQDRINLNKVRTEFTYQLPPDNSNETLDKEAKYTEIYNKTYAEVNQSLENIHYKTAGSANAISINKLINSNIPGYQIEKETGVSRDLVSRLRRKKANLLSITLLNAAKLTEYSNQLQSDGIIK